MRFRWFVLGLALLAAGRARASDLCPVWIGVGPKGALYELSPRGLPAKATDLNALRVRLQDGCTRDRLTPSRVTSVTVRVAPHAMRGNTATLWAMLAANGWPKSRVVQEAWSGAPR